MFKAIQLVAFHIAIFIFRIYTYEKYLRKPKGQSCWVFESGGDGFDADR